MQNFVSCPYVAGSNWNTDCFDRWHTIGGTGTKWYSTTGSLTYNRSGTRVRGLVSDGHGTIYVYKAQVVITYGVLKY